MTCLMMMLKKRMKSWEKKQTPTYSVSYDISTRSDHLETLFQQNISKWKLWGVKSSEVSQNCPRLTKNRKANVEKGPNSKLAI